MTEANQDILIPKKSRNPQRQAALMSGYSLLGLAVVIIIAQVLALAGILIEGDPGLTVENILSHNGRFRLGIFLHLAAVILDLVVAWALYIYLKPAGDQLSLLAAWARIAYTILFGIAVVNLYSVLQLLGSAAHLAAFNPAEIEAKVALRLAGFTDTWNIGYLFFGVHLTLLGVVAFRSGFIPKWIGVLLGLGGVSYLFDYSSLIVFPNLGWETSLVLGWGELIFMFWLLFRGGKTRPPAES